MDIVVKYIPAQDLPLMGGGDHDAWWIDDNQWDNEDRGLLGGDDHDMWWVDDSYGEDDHQMLGMDGHGTWNPEMWMDEPEEP